MIAAPGGAARRMEQAMEKFTARAVFDLYALLSDDDKRTFLKLLGQHCTAEVPFLIVNELPLTERERHSEMIFKEIWRIFPLMQREARALVRENPDVTDEEIDRRLNEQIKRVMEDYNRAIGELERAKLKDARDRKSDPETIKRYLELLDLRKKDPKHWSLNALAKRFGMTRQSVQQIVKEEAKWRRMGASN
jgi:hypothetical protein